MHGDLGVVGARLDAEVAAAALGLQRVALEARQRLERRGPARGQAEAVGAGGIREESGTEAEGDREPARGQAERLARVDRRRVVGASDGPALGDLEALGEAGRGIRPLGEQLDEPVTVERRRDVERGEVQAVLRGGDDAGLVSAEERVDGCPGAGRRPTPRRR